MEQPTLSQLTGAEILGRWPQTISVFLERKIACVSCAMASFATPAEAVNIYSLELIPFPRELQRFIPPLEAST